MSLRSNYVMLLNELNLDKLLPVMMSESLVSQAEYENFQCMRGRETEKNRRDALLTILPRKGKNYYSLFCKCIVWSGQIELAQRMGFDASLVQDLNKYYEYNPNTSYTSTVPPQPAAPAPITYTPPSVQPLPPLPPPSQPPATDDILILYCKDQYLHCAPDLTQENRRSAEDYCQEVSDFVETMTNLSHKKGSDGCGYQAYKFTYDRLAADGVFISNFLQWSDESIIRCSKILLLCSPQLAACLNSSSDNGGTVQMERGMFSKHSLINAIPHKPVIPVFLNMPKQQQWIPPPLSSASSYSVNIKALQEGCLGVASERDWVERVYTLFREDRRLDDLVDLRNVLCSERMLDFSPTNTPLPDPTLTDLSRTKLYELAVDVGYIWQELGTKLGVPFSVQLNIQHSSVDCTEKTKKMFDEWIRAKRHEATKQVLVEALRSCRYQAIADRVERTF